MQEAAAAQDRMCDAELDTNYNGSDDDKDRSDEVGVDTVT